ncbi:undecaprenyl diphosphate synthase family protein [Candidatus Dojkabacteria bacterium]|nr:undecaprenyl diphosphate synthase family protein [Candidatus Dojkabacteria bacterium]
MKLSDFHAITVVLSGHINKKRFLKTVSDKAKKLNIVGFAQFKQDNSCKIHAEGTKTVLSEFLDTLNRQTAEFDLNEVNVSWIDPYKIYNDFRTIDHPTWNPTVISPSPTHKTQIIEPVKYKKIPTHVAILPIEMIMWGKELYKPLTPWLRRTQRSFETIIELSQKLKIKYLTILEMHSSVWKLKTDQIRSQLHLTHRWIEFMQPFFNTFGIRLKVIGRRNRLPTELSALIAKVEKNTRNNKKLTFTLAIDYSGKNEITEAVNAIIQSKIPSVDENTLDSFLWTHELPPIDLVITNGGVTSLQGHFSCKAENASVYVSNKLFSELNTAEILKAIETFNNDQKILLGK